MSLSIAICLLVISAFCLLRHTNTLSGNVLNSFLPGQEEGNVDFVRDNGFGEYRNVPEEAAHLVVEYLSDASRLTQMSAAALAAGRPEATTNIAKGLARLVLD